MFFRKILENHNLKSEILNFLNENFVKCNSNVALLNASKLELNNFYIIRFLNKENTEIKKKFNNFPNKGKTEGVTSTHDFRKYNFYLGFWIITS